MGTEILQPQDCLDGRIRKSPALFPRRRGCNYGDSYCNKRTIPNPRPNPRAIRKQQQHPSVRSEKPDHKGRPGQPVHSDSKRLGYDGCKAGRIGLVMEKVTILRRGTSLDSKIKSGPSLKKKEGGHPAAKQVQSLDLRSSMVTERDVYAGSLFMISPEPTSLPLPSFSQKTRSGCC